MKRPTTDRPLTARQLACLRAVAELEADPSRRSRITAWHIAARTGLDQDVRRAGNGAVKGSWSGRVSPALGVGRTMRTLADRKLVYVFYTDRSKGLYCTTEEGRQLLGESR